MIIKTLVENTSISEEMASEHGLSLYIESKGLKILFDVGASGLFFENAKKLNVNIKDVDYLIISHGHYDHGGGLKTFFRENSRAKVFIHPLAFQKHYALRANDKLEFIGLEEEIRDRGQIVLTSDQFLISKEIQLLSNIIQREPGPLSNRGLFMERDNQITEDTFVHEQNLIIEEDGKTTLLTGCAHNGIVNIIKGFHDLKGRMPDYIIGGFHLSSRSSGGNEDCDMIDKISSFFIDTKAKYYTCHCTGLKPYKRLKERMGSSIDYLSAGSEIRI